MTQFLRNTLIAFYLTYSSISYGQTDSTETPILSAQFPGGQSALLKYFKTNVSDKVSPIDNGTPVEKVIAKFYVDARGRAINAKIVKTSRHENIDLKFIEAINSMPTWTPAENSNGKKVGQEITLPMYLCTR